jgi:two-component system nitrogen regulation response regulator GlnG
VSPARAPAFIADDEDSIRFVLRETLGELGFEVEEASDGNAALTALSARSFAIAFLDIRMPGPSGLELLDRVRATGSETPVVIITAQNTFENAVEAMKRGALDYLTKPFGVAEVRALAEKALRNQRLENEVRELRRELGQRPVPGERMVGRSPALLEIFKTVGRLAAREVFVLITGESGTGKELVARAIHAASARAAGPFVAVNTAAIPRELLESELFGHERGAFTGAIGSQIGRFREAAGGTLFLDEIGDMPLELQAKLLRVLQTQEVTPVGGRGAIAVDLRILAATHRDLDAAVREGSFREDLLYRLRVVPLAIPPLRERRDDIPVLAQHFVLRYAQELAGAPRVLTEACLEALAAEPWPGNVRQLENAVKRALVLGSSEVLSPEDFAFLGAEARAAAESGEVSLEDALAAEIEREFASGEPADLHPRLLARIERPLIEDVLRRAGGNQLRAAALLGINRNTLRKKLTELGIEIPGREN